MRIIYHILAGLQSQAQVLRQLVVSPKQVRLHLQEKGWHVGGT